MGLCSDMGTIQSAGFGVQPPVDEFLNFPYMAFVIDRVPLPKQFIVITSMKHPVPFKSSKIDEIRVMIQYCLINEELLMGESLFCQVHDFHYFRVPKYMITFFRNKNT